MAAFVDYQTLSQVNILLLSFQSAIILTDDYLFPEMDVANDNDSALSIATDELLIDTFRQFLIDLIKFNDGSNLF